MDPDVQHIWVYCKEPDAESTVLDFCRDCRRLRLVSEIVALPKKADWRPRLQSTITSILPPYSGADWEDFWSDVDAFLAATIGNDRYANAQLKALAQGELAQAVRWPSLFVTDRIKLCKAMSTNVTLKLTLAEAVDIEPHKMLPIVLAEDFGLLSGQVVMEPPLPSCSSLVASAQSERAESANSEDVAETQHVQLRCGVYLQRRPSVASDSAEADATSAECATYGARCLALLSNGRCAYSAISSDGVRAVEASGPWEVMNGQVILGGAAGQATVSHFTLSGGGLHVAQGVEYEEPVHVSLESLMTDFDSPISLADCVPQGSERLKLELNETKGAVNDNTVNDSGEASGIEPELCEVVDEPHKVPPGSGALPLDATFNKRWESKRTFPESSAQGGPHLATSKHALLSVAAESSAHEDAHEESALPRLLGKDHGITDVLEWELDKYDPPSPGWSPWAALLDNIPDHVSHRDSCAPTSIVPCPLKPGTYTYEDGGPPSEYAHKSLRLVLRAGGQCRIREITYGKFLRSTAETVRWGVQKQILVLSSPDRSAHGFSLREKRGHRSTERRVGRVEIPVAFVLKSCTYAPFAQRLDPFPGHVALDEGRRVFGLIDPHSPVMHFTRCRPERLPFHAFEHDLRRRGLPCDEIISDFHFLDRDHDGQVTIADMRVLTTYGNEQAAPEVVEELRLALIHRFGSLERAFDELAVCVADGQVSLDGFEQFLQKEADEDMARQSKVNGDNKQLAEWVAKTTAEDRAGVFSTLNPNNNPAIELGDFMSLNLYGAVLAVRRLAHFKGWVSEEFGSTGEVLARVFAALDHGRSDELSRFNFTKGVQALGYPCRPATIKSIFSLLDRNVDGVISSRDFQRLGSFDAEVFLTSLAALKRFAEQSFGGIDECWQVLQQTERGMPTCEAPSSKPKRVSFAAFQKLFTKAGFGQEAKDADLRMLFLFLDGSGEHRADGYITYCEWSVLKGLDSSAIKGSPARLRKILAERYGGMDQAFIGMHSKWLKRALHKGLMQTALAGLARAIRQSGKSLERSAGDQRSATNRSRGDLGAADSRGKDRRSSRQGTTMRRPSSQVVSAPRRKSHVDTNAQVLAALRSNGEADTSVQLPSLARCQQQSVNAQRCFGRVQSVPGLQRTALPSMAGVR